METANQCGGRNNNKFLYSALKLNSMRLKKENIFCQKVDVVKNKNLEDVTAEQLQAEARCIVQHPALEETGEG